MNLNLLDYQKYVKIRKSSDRVEIFDFIRSKFIMLSPEEHVRQLFLHFLTKKMNYSRNRISVERALKYNKMEKRFDVLIYSSDMKPLMLVECKAPRVKIKQETMEQVATYNQVFKVPYLCVTNGAHTYVFKINYEDKSFQAVENFPAFS